jgi:lysophospholipase L1-like esterase
MKYDTLWSPSVGETIVFTGSSSIRLWRDIPELFPGYSIVNTGFGGSQTSDLIAYSEELVLRFRPRQVFIYEGDNDIGAGKKPGKVLKDTKTLVRNIHDRDSATRIVLIAAKPSIRRWSLHRRYQRFNRKLGRLSKKSPYLDYADVWEVMMDKGELRRDLFIEDGLHMNEKGYQLWYGVIKEFID